MGAAFAHTANAKNRYLEPSVAPVFCSCDVKLINKLQALSAIKEYAIHCAKQLSEAKCIIIIIVPSQITSSSQKGWPIHDSPPSRPTLTTRFAKWWLSAVTPTDGISFHEWPVPTVDQQALFSSVQQVRSKMVAPKRTRRAKEMLCSWPSLPRRFRSDHPGTWKLWQRSKAQGGSIEIVDNSINIMVWHYVIQYDTIWYNMIQYDTIWFNMLQYDMKWHDMIWYGAIWYV